MYKNLPQLIKPFFALLRRHCPQFLFFFFNCRYIGGRGGGAGEGAFAAEITHQICFFHPFFCPRNLASREKFYTLRYLPHSFPYKWTNEKARIALYKVENFTIITLVILACFHFVVCACFGKAFWAFTALAGQKPRILR